MDTALVERLKAEMGQRATMFRALIDESGEQILAVVAQHTIEQTRARLAAADLNHRDLDAVMELLWDQIVPGTEFVVEERTEECLRLRVTKCLFADEMLRLGAADIGDAFYCAYDYGFCQGLNPAIEFSRTRTLMNGDDCCDHTYRLKTA